MICLIIIICICMIPIFALIILGLSPSKYNYAKIKFESFKKFYDINPNRWELHDDHVNCLIETYYNSLLNKYERFQFDFVDYRKYVRWLKNKKERDKEMANMESTAKMIAAVRQDISKLEKTADRQIKKSVSILESLYEV